MSPALIAGTYSGSTAIPSICKPRIDPATTSGLFTKTSRRVTTTTAVTIRAITTAKTLMTSPQHMGDVDDAGSTRALRALPRDIRHRGRSFFRPTIRVWKTTHIT